MFTKRRAGSLEKPVHSYTICPTNGHRTDDCKVKAIYILSDDII